MKRLLSLFLLASVFSVGAVDTVLYSTRETPIILGATNGTEGDTLTFSNAMFSAWGVLGSVSTNYATFSALLVNGTVSPTNQVVTLDNGRATGSKTVLVTPIPVSANFSGTPTSGTPPLTVTFTNSTVGVFTNALWNFGVLTNGGSAFTTQTLAGSVSVTFGSDTNDFRTNSVSLTVAGYPGTSTVTQTNYVMAVPMLPPGAVDIVGTAVIGTPATALYSVEGVADYTIEFWVRDLTGDGSGLYYNFLIWGSDYGGDDGWRLDAGSNCQFTMNGGATTIVPSTYNITDSNWHHVAHIRSSGNYINYVDGTNATGTVTQNGPPTGTGPTSLHVPQPGDWPRNGSLGPIRISSSVRYSGTFTPASTWASDTNTLGLWSFSEGTGTTSADLSGNGNDFTLSGAAWTTFP